MAGLQQLLDSVVSEVGKALAGKELQIRLALCCMLCRGHLLLEDLPGMGKTTLALALGRVLGLQAQRIQFTSDLLPADILGVSVYETTTSQFSFHPGPIFHPLILADEINRTTPKTQSALLEAMEERQVSVEGVTRPLPDPFFVIATQNPLSHSGTYPLPGSQLDRFFMRLALGYPDPDAERLILLGQHGREQLTHLTQQLSVSQLKEMQQQVSEIRVSEPLLSYLQRLIEHSRSQESFPYGLSSRGALALLRAGQCWSMMNGRNYVIPEDLQVVLPAVVEHRLQEQTETGQQSAEALSQRLLRDVDVIAE
ncbi:AAA family ATPase [Dongshaea marina]|uniref:AAA family ATPase n=1 Tax=Dongshaea marina TaxID=2047966 RepID=UPI001F43A3B0|nr:AAA family ATPase [Dongshaea marina]